MQKTCKITILVCRQVPIVSKSANAMGLHGLLLSNDITLASTVAACPRNVMSSLVIENILTKWLALLQSSKADLV